jgi:hypothetical protein
LNTLQRAALTLVHHRCSARAASSRRVPTPTLMLERVTLQNPHFEGGILIDYQIGSL